MRSSRIDLKSGTVRDADGVSSTLRPSALHVLSILAENSGKTVSKYDLLDRAWPDTEVTENSLQQCIHEIRQGLGSDGAKIIQTVPKRGYRLTVCADNTGDAPPKHHRLRTAVFAFGMIVVAIATWVIETPKLGNSLTRSVLVLPFENLTGDERWNLLATGLTQDTAADLAQSNFLRVVEGAHPKPQSTADYTLRGSFQNEAGVIRVQSWLTDVSDGSIVWSHRWNGNEQSIFDLQDAVVAGVSAALASPWTGVIAQQDMSTARSRNTNSLAAYELFLLASHHKHRFTPEDYEIAEGYLKRAIQIDPNYAKAYSTLAVVYALMGSNISTPADLKPVQAARVAAISAAERLAPNDPQTLVQMNWLMAFQGDFEGAEKKLRRAVELAPHNPDVLAEAGWVGNWRSVLGEDSLEWVERAKAMNDDWPDWYAVGVGIGKFNLGDYEGAVAALTEAPDFIERHLYTAAAEALRGNFERAAAARERLKVTTPAFDLKTYMAARIIVQNEVREPLLKGARLAGVPGSDF